ncbi:MAG: calcium/sodium antiporter [Patescibacteria group bacterium]|nr:calcium/sodium antiporter [Patescibacteria group bacterium]MBU2509013.1 calcium/sodium antiporter [Patescibacteria group bacterium]
MPELVLWGGIFILSLLVLIRSANYFTDAAIKIGLYLGIPSFIVGVTIIAVGTSLPELISSIIAVVSESSEIVVGNVVGSNITNIFLILGITALIGKKLKISHELIRIDLPLFIASSFLLAITIWDGKFSLPEAILCLLALAIYLSYTTSSQNQIKTIKKQAGMDGREKKDWKTLIILIVSMGFIYLGAQYTIESVIHLSGILNIGKEIIAVTAVALGTSLPELVVCMVAAKKGNLDIVVGNILGSNIFNALAVMGIPALFGTLIIPHSILVFSLPVMIIATLLYFFITQDKQITKWEGAILIVFYIFFIGKIFGLL